MLKQRRKPELVHESNNYLQRWSRGHCACVRHGRVLRGYCQKTPLCERYRVGGALRRRSGVRLCVVGARPGRGGRGALMLMSVVVLDIACLAAAHLSLSRRAASGRLMLAAAPSDWTAYRVVSVFVALTALAAAAALCVLAVELPHNFALEQVNAKRFSSSGSSCTPRLWASTSWGSGTRSCPRSSRWRVWASAWPSISCSSLKGSRSSRETCSPSAQRPRCRTATCTRCPLSACGGSPQAWRRCLCASCWRASAAGPSTSATRASRLPTGTRASSRTRSPARPCSRASCRT